MKKRPRSITIIGSLFVGAGTIGLAHHATEFKAQRPFEYELIWVYIVVAYFLFCPQASVAYFRGTSTAK
jgi:hypothetical protein